MKAKKRLTDFDFSGEGAHMALVHESQGAANGFKTLVMKSEIDITKMSENQIQNLKDIVKACNNFSEEEAEEYIQSLSEEVNKDTNGVSPVSDVNEETPNEVIKDMSTEVIEKSVVEALVAEAIEKANAAKQVEIEALEKSLNEFKEAQEIAKKAEFVEKAAEFEILGVEDKEAFGIALMKMAEQDELKVVSEVLAKALNIAKNVGEISEEGHSVEVQDSAVSGVMKAIEARKAANK